MRRPYQLSDTALSQWCQRDIPNFPLSEFATQNQSALIIAFQSTSNLIAQSEYKSLLWSSFQSSGLNILKICEQLRKPLCSDPKNQTYQGLTLNLWSYICYLNILVIDGAGANGIFDVGIFQYAVEQPQSVCRFLINEVQNKTSNKSRSRPSAKSFDEDNDEGDSGSLRSPQIGSLLQLVNKLFTVLNMVMERVSLAQSDLSQHMLVTRLASALHYCTYSKPKELSKILDAKLCLKVLGTYMTNPIHQLTLIQDSILMKHLMPIVLMRNPNQLDGSTAQATLTQPVVRMAELTVQLIRDLIQEKPEASQSAFILAQHVTVGVVDKMEYRSKTADSLVSIISLFPEYCYEVMSEWLFSKLHSSKQNERLFVLEVLEKLLNFSSSTGTENRMNLDHEQLVGSILDRCSDKVPSIRAKAFSCISTMCKLRSEAISTVLKTKLRSMLRDGSENQGNEEPYNSALTMPPDLDPNLHDSGAITLGENESCFELIFLPSCRDEKCNVRKAALQAFVDVVVCLLSTSSAKQLIIAALNEASTDATLVIRKQAIESSTKLLHEFALEHQFKEAWLVNVMPLFSDPEKAVVERAISVFEVTVLTPLSRMESSDDLTCSSEVLMAWSLLDILTLSDNYMYFFRLGAAELCGQVLQQSVEKLVDCVRAKRHEVSCWMLLSRIMKTEEWKIIANEALKEVTSNLTMDNSIVEQNDRFRLSFIMDILCFSSPKSIPKADMSSAVNSLLAVAGKVSLPLHCATDILGAVSVITEKYELQEVLQNYAIFTAEGTKEAIKTYDPSVYLMDEPAFDNESFMRKLFIVGQLTFCNLQECSNALSSLKSCFKPLLKMMQSLLSIRKQNAENPELDDEHMASVQAVGVIAIGNMCLIFEEFNKQGADLLGDLIAPSTHDDYRENYCSLKVANNVIIVLCDLCKRYTHTVERFLPRIYRYLACPDSFLRYQTLAVVFELLQNEYIKIRDSLFFRMLTLYVDETEKVARLAEYCLDHMATRHRSLFFTHLPETLFFLNEHHTHPKYNQFPKEGLVRSGLGETPEGNEEIQPEMEIPVAVSAHQNKRLLVYQFLAQHLSEQQKFQLKVRLMTEVVGCYVKSSGPVEPTFENILSDVLKLFTLKAMKTASGSRENTDPDNNSVEPKSNSGQSVTETSSTTSSAKFTEMVRDVTVEQFLPVMLSLREKLKQEQKEKLLVDVLTCLGDMIKDYKNDLGRILDREETKSVETEIKQSQYVPIRQYKRLNLTSTFDYSLASNLTGVGFESSFFGASSVSGSTSGLYRRPSSVFSRTSSGEISISYRQRESLTCASPVVEKEAAITNMKLLTPIEEASREGSNSQSQNILSQNILSQNVLSQPINNENAVTSTPFKAGRSTDNPY